MKVSAKHTLILFLASVMLLQGICGGLVWIHFQMNKQYIAENLCENRDKPEMQCEGHCQLRKNLKKAETEDSSTPIPKTTKAEVIICERIDFPEIKPALTEYLIHSSSSENEDIKDSQPSRLFRPPIAV